MKINPYFVNILNEFYFNKEINNLILLQINVK